MSPPAVHIARALLCAADRLLSEAERSEVVTVDTISIAIPTADAARAYVASGGPLDAAALDLLDALDAVTADAVRGAINGERLRRLDVRARLLRAALPGTAIPDYPDLPVVNLLSLARAKLARGLEALAASLAPPRVTT